MLLALFNLLPLRQLDGGRALYLMLSWLLDPITADRIGHGVGCFFLCVALLLTAALQGQWGCSCRLSYWNSGSFCAGAQKQVLSNHVFAGKMKRNIIEIGRFICGENDWSAFCPGCRNRRAMWAESTIRW